MLSADAEIAVTRGDCAFVVRMRQDFNTRALPLAHGGYLDPGYISIERSTWSEIFQAANRIIDQCIRGSEGPRPGWNTVASASNRNDQGIVVAFWPRNSAMNGLFGPGVGVFSSANTNETDAAFSSVAILPEQTESVQST